MNICKSESGAGMRIVITGAAGFVGPHLVEALRHLFDNNVEIIATSKVGGLHPVLGRVLPLDVTDPAAVAEFITDARPHHVLHLAGIAAVGASNTNPDLTWAVHLHGTLNLARAILAHCPECWLFNVGSGLVYGESAKAGQALDEHATLAPTDEYSASKAGADLALGALARHGLKCVRLRPFNHTGPGQTEDFVVPSFAMQIARIEAGQVPAVIRVGNLDAQRDFLDVRDVARAYALAVGSVGQLRSGTVLNIASGVPRRMSEILKALLSNCLVQISIEEDASRLRPSDIPIFVGDAGRARSVLGWSPRHSFYDTLTAVLNDARSRHSG